MLPPTEAHHLTRVLRGRPGDPVELFDGAGHSAMGHIAQIHAGEVWLQFGPIAHDPDPVWSATLVVGLLKGDKRDEIVRAAVALGWERLMFVPTRYSQARELKSEPGQWTERCMAVAINAAKQCGRNRLPRIEFMNDLNSAIQSTAVHISCFGSFDPSARSLVDLLTPENCPSAPRTGRFVVGPEGGLAPEEETWLKSQGFSPVRWAPYVLRSELAAIALMAVVAAHWGS